MLGRRVLRLVARGADKLDLDLKRRVAQKAGKLGLGRDLRRHQVQNQYFQRSDILSERTGLGHHEDVFLGEGFCRRESVRYFYRHCQCSLWL